MKTRILPVMGALFLFFFINAAANASPLRPDTASCCLPDSLKVLSTNYPVFCVSWHISSDSGCTRPYGFTVQWRLFPGNGPWKEKTVLYGGSSTQVFCDSVDTCANYQWRVRTICIINGSTTYSDWVYGPKFRMNCTGGELKQPGRQIPANKRKDYPVGMALPGSDKNSRSFAVNNTRKE